MPCEAVVDAVAEGEPGGFDDVEGDADGGPGGVAVAGLDEDAGFGGGAAAGVDDADFVIDEFHVCEVGVKADQRFTQGGVECVYGAVAFRHGMDFFAVDEELDRGFAGVLVFRAIFADGDVVFEQLKGSFVLAQRFADEQFEGGVGGLEFVAFVFEVLDLFEHLERFGFFFPPA